MRVFPVWIKRPFDVPDELNEASGGSALEVITTLF